MSHPRRRRLRTSRPVIPSSTPSAQPSKSSRRAATAAHSFLRKSRWASSRMRARSSSGTRSPAASDQSKGPRANQPNRRSAAWVAVTGPRTEREGAAAAVAHAACDGCSPLSQVGPRRAHAKRAASTAASATVDGGNSKSARTALRHNFMGGKHKFVSPQVFQTPDEHRIQGCHFADADCFTVEECKPGWWLMEDDWKTTVSGGENKCRPLYGKTTESFR